LVKTGRLARVPLLDSVAAVSCGICAGQPLLDLDYKEDSSADVDANFVLTGAGRIVEIQGTAEQDPFTRQQLTDLLDLAQKGAEHLSALQKEAIEGVL